MTQVNAQLGTRSLWQRLSQAPSWGIVVAAALLMAVPTIRTCESSQLDTAKERVEEVSLIARAVNLTRPSARTQRQRTVFNTSQQLRRGRSPRPLSFHVAGHRLANGLLAPMTC